MHRYARSPSVATTTRWCAQTMNLQHTLKTAVSYLRDGLLDNEARVKQSVILPVLRALDWDDGDPRLVTPEFSTGSGPTGLDRVDYALLNNKSPLVFIEAKRVGAINANGEEQLFGYANNKGVPILVLTDGNRWDFYLSMAAGIPAERRFYQMYLEKEEKISEHALFLEEHLRKDRVVSGEAKRNAEERHDSNLQRERARQAIPSTWQALLQEPDERLRDLLAEEVERECGITPELDDIEEFLRNLLPPLSSDLETRLTTPSIRREIKESGRQRVERTRIVGFVLKGDEFETGTGRKTLVEILNMFEHDHPEFMERFAVRTASTKRNLVAKNQADLYQQSHLVEEHSMKLENGWWFGTNLSTKQIEKHIRTACDVAGIKFGTELKLIER